MRQSKRPLLEAIYEHSQNNPISFHVPGHKDGLVGLDIFPKQVTAMDLTELTGLDNLHAPEGIILEAERLLSEVYQSQKSFFLVNGTTVGNLAMILATVGKGNRVLVQRNAHISVMNGLKIVEAVPVFISPETNEQLGIAGEITLASVQEGCKRFPDIKAIILNYPDYYGFIYELKAIIEFAHEKNIPILVDEAHGAHFQVGKPFPPSALALGADVVVQSAHKTLPALTMASFLHVNSQLVNVEALNESLRMLQSSSPSYLLMASLDHARAFVQNFSEADILYSVDEYKSFSTALKKIPGLQLIQTDDPLKMVLQSTNGLTGYALQEKLEQEGVYPEMADLRNVLLILPLLKVGQNYPFNEAVKRMAKAVGEIKSRECQPLINVTLPTVTSLAINFSEMKKMPKRDVPFRQAVGHISAENVIPYPPGIPLILQGEKISQEAIDSLQKIVAQGGKVQGCAKIMSKEISVYLTNDEKK